ncbi:unnamed protein product, partial [Urochloa humidicola]
LSVRIGFFIQIHSINFLVSYNRTSGFSASIGSFILSRGKALLILSHRINFLFSVKYLQLRQEDRRPRQLRPHLQIR